MARADGCHSEELNESIKSSFNTVLLASQRVIKQYNILQSTAMNPGMYYNDIGGISNIIYNYLDEECNYIEHWGKAYTTVMTIANSSDIQQVTLTIAS